MALGSLSHQLCTAAALPTSPGHSWLAKTKSWLGEESKIPVWGPGRAKGRTVRAPQGQITPDKKRNSDPG